MTQRIDLATLRIVLYPDPVLRAVCRPVEQFGDDLERLARRMLELMRQGEGVGLAAPQVGLKMRLFVANPTGEPDDDLICVNPRLSELSGAEEREEGCLSIPNIAVPVRRATRLHLRAFDVRGRPFEREGTDLAARVWLHEADHLDGRLILDYMSETVRIANRRVLRQLQADYKQSA